MSNSVSDLVCLIHVSHAFMCLIHSCVSFMCPIHVCRRLGVQTEARVNKSIYRVLNLRFLTGQFDPLENQPYV
jgi:hypothetical protein